MSSTSAKNNYVYMSRDSIEDWRAVLKNKALG